jgi:hypothetical protein
MAETIWSEKLTCFYGSPYCSGSLWQCQTCKEWFCEAHWHDTALGYCIECAACEYERKQIKWTTQGEGG